MPKLILNDNREYGYDKMIEVSNQELAIIKFLNKKFGNLATAAKMNPEAEILRDELYNRKNIVIYETIAHL